MRRRLPPWRGVEAIACVLLWPLLAGLALAGAQDEATAQRLRAADALKLGDYPRFSQLLASLEAQSGQLDPENREYLDYLRGWNTVYKGDYETAITQLNRSVAGTHNLTLKFRATTTLVNVLSLSKRYEEAFSRLNSLLELLPQVTNGDAREQALLVAAYTYVQVGQYDLALRYAQMVIDENWLGRGDCKGGELKLEALYRSGRLTTLAPFQAEMDACEKLEGGATFANAIRSFAAELAIAQHRYDDAISMLKQHYPEVVQSRYTRLISTYDALLAEAYHRKGLPSLAREFGLDTIQSAPPHEYTEPLVSAYAVLYELAKGEGDFKAALAYHEQYAAADKAYLDDVSARHLAYQKVTHENIANRLQVDALNKQNHVLQLQRQLGAKAVETSRLYIALLILAALSIAMWAYRTKRSQLHFMQLSRLDGLTGISNRLHFIAQAQRVLESGGKTREPLCIALCDLDHFKTINDRHGHATGDYVLKRVVTACKAHLRADDLFGRFGGEEFGFLFPACGPSEARRRAEQLRAAITAISTKMDDVELNVSASFGVAATIASGYELRQLLAHADTALYEAKRAGRNRVVLHEGGHSAAAHSERSQEERIRDLPETKRIVGG